MKHTLSIAVAGALTIVAGCASTTPDPEVAGILVERSPNPAAPLVALCSFTTNEPTLAWAEVTDGARTFDTPAGTEFKTEHELVILGMEPDTRYDVSVHVTTRDGRSNVAEPVAYKTLPLPQDFPPIEVLLAKPDQMEPGYTFVPFTRWPKGAGPDRSFGVLIALDNEGRIVWYYQANHHLSDVFRAQSGNLIYHHGRFGHVKEIDMLGNLVKSWHATGSAKRWPEGSIPVQTTTFHHELQELPNGNFMALSLEVREFDQYPQSENDPDVPWGHAYVIGDVVVEYRPDGTVVDMWSLMDILDPFRICYDSLDTGFWQDVFQDKLDKPGFDWSHANAIDYWPDDHAILVSIYHQDAAVKIDLETKEVEWIIGFPTGWREKWNVKLLTPVGDGLYPCHQHSARRTPDGTVIMFDNGAFRARPFDAKMAPEDSFSRAVEYEIDEENLTFKQIWSYGGPGDEQFFSPILGEVEWMPKTGNILVTDGARIRRPDGGPGGHPNHGKEWARVVEVTRTEPAKKVFEFVVEDPKWGWTIYRSERIPSLYGPR